MNYKINLEDYLNYWKNYSDAAVEIWFGRGKKRPWPDMREINWDMVENQTVFHTGNVNEKRIFLDEDCVMIPPAMLRVAANWYNERIVQEDLPNFPVTQKYASLILLKSHTEFCVGCGENRTVMPENGDFCAYELCGERFHVRKKGRPL